MKRIYLLMKAGILAAGLSACVSEQAKLMSQAEVSRSVAEKTALAKVPRGTVQDGELENENGKLIWSFDISKPGEKDVTEVAVDAELFQWTRKHSLTKPEKKGAMRTTRIRKTEIEAKCLGPMNKTLAGFARCQLCSW